MRADGVPQDIRMNNSALIDYVRRGVDVIVKKAVKDENTNLARIAGNIADGINKEVDDILASKGSTVYADARATAQKGFQFSEGADQGVTLLGDKTLSAEGVRRIVNKAAPIQKSGIEIGVREDLRRRMMNAESAFGEAKKRGATKGRQILSSTEARGKIEAVFGPNPAKEITRVTDAEGRFAANSNAIIAGSPTAPRLAAQKEFPNAVVTADKANELGKKNWAGILNEQAYRAINKLMNGALDERRLLIAEDAAKMLVAQGADRDQIAQALMTIANRQGVSQAQRARIGAIVGNLTQRSLPALFSNVNSSAEPVK